MLNAAFGIALMSSPAAYGGTLPAGSAWDTTFNSANYTFSNGNLTANRPSTSAAGDESVRGTLSKSSGYFEVVVDSMAANGSVGILTSAAATGDFVGNDGIGLYSGNGNVYHTGGVVTTLVTFAVGDVIGVCVKSNFIYFAKNGTWLGGSNPSAGTGGIDISAWFTSGFPGASSNSNAATSQFTLRTSSGFTGTIPTGATAWG